MRFSLLFTSFVLLLLLHSVSNSVAVTVFHRCIHDIMTERVGSVLSEGDRRTASIARAPNVQSVTEKLELPERKDPHRDWQPIRIKIFVEDLEKGGRYCTADKQKVLNDFGEEVDCTSEDVLTPEKKDILVNTILKEAVQLHTERLYVEPLKGKLVVPKFTDGNICANFTVPEEHYTDGVEDADMVLYVAAVPHKMQLQRSFAWAVSCATLGTQEQPGRPVVGVMNYAPKYIVATTQQVRVAAHEIAHVLGFSVKEMERLQMVKDVNDVRKKGKISVVSSTNTLRETRRQYNCNTTEGMELEDQAPPKSKKSQGGDKGPGKNSGAQPAEKAAKRERSGPDSKKTGRNEKGGKKESGLKDGSSNEASSHLEGPSNAQKSRSSSSSGDGQYGKSKKEKEKKKTPEKRTKNDVTSTGQQSAEVPRKSLLTSDVADVQGAPKEEKIIAVEKQRELPTRSNTFSHWKRRNAKDELMAGIVGVGYYTALTMAAFADLDYYMVDWSKAELMSWGNHSGCKLLDEKCVKEGNTQYTDMFCTTQPTNDTPLQCTSDRHALGRCFLKDVQPLSPPSPTELAPHFQYFANKNMGTTVSELMDHCPFIAANNETWCTDGIEEKMPGSIIASNSRCVKGEELKVKEKNIGDVCVKVSCRNGTVSVKYKGNDKWHACAEGTKLNVDTTELKGHIVCPKYYDVCNTINRTLDELEGPQPPKPETQPETPEANNPTPAAENLTDSASQGTKVSTATTTTTSTPSTQGPATPNGDANDATATGDVAAGALDSNNSVSIEIRHTDVVAAPAAAAALFVPFVCLLLVTTMVAVS